ncbi:hypothetical protein OU682_11920 [Paracoccus sp. EF6]|uniref:Uncharacterized protein n=1 Tax=Paracoccus benzoatiresistens TaxID=2997341 RepID=A0ABT4J5G7_9RHOB|nr:hypothetical protein [Paracoccus sp. EF6]MCZ0962327.1 hypothetical protein [Paracoccus sp. EF6]
MLDLHRLKVAPALVSRVPDAVLEEVREWQNRALDRTYSIRRPENGAPPRFLILLHLRRLADKGPGCRQPHGQEQGRPCGPWCRPRRFAARDQLAMMFGNRFGAKPHGPGQIHKDQDIPIFIVFFSFRH